MATIISIPSAERDERIGSVFNHLFHIIFENNRMTGHDVIWDFSSKVLEALFLCCQVVRFIGMTAMEAYM